MQIVLFLTLGLLVFPSDILPVIGIGLVISLFLILVARPASVFISMLPFKMGLSDKVFISWVGLRGAVPIVFATYPLLAGIENAGLIFNIVFFISVTSVLIQGTTLSILAKWLKLDGAPTESKNNPLDEFMEEPKNALLEEITVEEKHHVAGKKLVELHFPSTAIIAMIKRNDQYLTPNGSTRLEIDDKLFILSSNKEGIDEVMKCFNENFKQ